MTIKMIVITARCPALARVAHHLAEGIAQRRRDKQDGQHFQKIGEGGRVFEGMGRVDIEEPAAVGAELFDGNLRAAGPVAIVCWVTTWPLASVNGCK